MPTSDWERGVNHNKNKRGGRLLSRLFDVHQGALGKHSLNLPRHAGDAVSSRTAPFHRVTLMAHQLRTRAPQLRLNSRDGHRETVSIKHRTASLGMGRVNLRSGAERTEKTARRIHHEPRLIVSRNKRPVRANRFR